MTSELMVAVRNAGYSGENEQDSSEECSVEEISQEEDSSLSIFAYEDKMTLEAYRGNDRKYTITAYVVNEKNRKIAAETKLQLEKYSRVNIDMPLSIEECGTYYAVAEGLGFDLKEKIEKACAVTQTEEESIPASKSAIPAVIFVNPANTTGNFSRSPITADAVYESRGQTSKNISFIGIIIICAGGLIYVGYRLIMRRRPTKG